MAGEETDGGQSSMPLLPRISVVTPSYNQGRFLARTIDSVRAQGYSNLEHIVVDGMSTDDTCAVLARYPHLRVLREPDCGQSEAINKGFRLATGDIFCFLNSDDTLLPGALQRVACEIDPHRDRHVVMGRCCHIDEDDQVLCVEHPSAFLGHRRMLEVWKIHTIPQPATFWTAEVWRCCGPLDEREQMVPDYDLFCRFSRRYHFHFIDQVLATYRLHARSKTCTREDAHVLREAIRVSRRYWGSPLRLQFWQLLGSLTWYRLEQVLQRKRRAAALMDGHERALGNGNMLLGLAFLSGAVMCAPDLSFRRALLPRMGRHLERWWPQRAGADLWHPGHTSPATLAWRGFTGLYKSDFIGPTFISRIRVEPTHRVLELHLEGVTRPMPRPLNIDFYLDNQLVHQCRLRMETLAVCLPVAQLRPGTHELKIISSSYMVPHEHLGNGDFRPLSAKLRRLQLLPASVRRFAAEHRWAA
jgi:glycosyltransferase involved in cell wall biosynthesis